MKKNHSQGKEAQAERPLQARDHLRYWGRVLEGHVHWLIRVMIAPFLIFLIFATGAWVQEYQDWSWKSVLPLWVLFILSVAGLRYLRLHSDDSDAV